MNRFDDDELHDLAGAYALDAVDNVERQAFERHLRGCERCQEEVASFGDAVLELAQSVPPVPPPPSLKQSVLDQLPEQEAPQPSTRSTARRRAVPRERSRNLLIAAAAAVVAVLGGGIMVAQPWNEPTVVASLDEAARVQTAADAQRYEGKAGRGRVVVTVSEREGRATVQSESLASLPKDRAYQGWFLDSAGTPRSAGLVVPGRTQVLKGTPGAVFALTVEPAAGSPAPTSEPTMALPLS